MREHPTRRHTDVMSGGHVDDYEPYREHDGGPVLPDPFPASADYWRPRATGRERDELTGRQATDATLRPEAPAGAIGAVIARARARMLADLAESVSAAAAPGPVIEFEPVDPWTPYVTVPAPGRSAQ